MIYTIKSKSKHLNLKRNKFFLTRIKFPIKLIPLNLKWLLQWLSTTNSPSYFMAKSVVLK